MGYSRNKDINAIAKQACECELITVKGMNNGTYLVKLNEARKETRVATFEEAANFIRRLNNGFAYDNYVIDFPEKSQAKREDELRKACEQILLSMLKNAWDEAVGAAA
jgi:hypothetical protein